MVSVSVFNSKINTYDDIVNQIIWNNKNIVVQKASVFVHHLFLAGVVKIRDLLSDMYEGSKVSEANLSTMHVCYASPLCNTTVELQMLSNHSKVTATRE